MFLIYCRNDVYLTSFFKSDRVPDQCSTVSTPISVSSASVSAVTSAIQSEAPKGNTSSCTNLLIPTERIHKDEYILRGPLRDAVDAYPKNKIKGKCRSFQCQWFKDRSWLEYVKDMDAAFCFPCCVFCTSTNDVTFQ